MKKVVTLFVLAFVLIAGVMFYLLKRGVVLRPEPLIKPSAMTEGTKTIARDLSLRLFPQFQDMGYVVWGLNAEDSEALDVLSLLKVEEERSKGRTIRVFSVSDKTTREEIKSCEPPCWLLRPQQEAHQLKPNPFIKDILAPVAAEQGKAYLTMTVVPFEFDQVVPPECLAERRLDFECIQKISVQSTLRRLPKEIKAELEAPSKEGTPAESFVRGSPRRQRYFFLTKYNESDFFLFIETPARL